MKRAWKMLRYLMPISPHFLLVRSAIRNCKALRTEGKSGPLVSEEQVRKFKEKMDRSMEPDPQVLRVLANVIVRPLSVIFERSGQTGVFL